MYEIVFEPFFVVFALELVLMTLLVLILVLRGFGNQVLILRTL